MAPHPTQLPHAVAAALAHPEVVLIVTVGFALLILALIELCLRGEDDPRPISQSRPASRTSARTPDGWPRSGGGNST